MDAEQIKLVEFCAHNGITSEKARRYQADCAEELNVVIWQQALLATIRNYKPNTHRLKVAAEQADFWKAIVAAMESV